MQQQGLGSTGNYESGNDKRNPRTKTCRVWRMFFANLPAGSFGKPSKLHTESSAPGAWMRTGVLRAVVGVARTSATSKLDSQARAFQVCSICFISVRASCGQGMEKILRKAGEREFLDRESMRDHLPGTTSRASMGSSYSTKPKPFMSLISVMLPVP